MSANKQDKQQRPKVEFDAERELKIMMASLRDPQLALELKKLLGPDIDYDRFVSTTTDVLHQKPALLDPTPAFRSSLLFALKKAARQGLEPDGSQGALIPRYDQDARCQLVQWQPMVRGVQLAAKRAGIKKIQAEFVLVGEPFRVLGGDDEKIEHEWKTDIRDKAYGLLRQIRQGPPDPNAPPDEAKPTSIIARDFDAFWDMIAAAYCIITMPDGEKVRRVMPRTRLLLLRDFSKARGASPWFGPFCDEMIVKSAIHFGAKRTPMEASDDKQRERIARFRDALDDGMEADFESGADNDRPTIEGRTVHREPPPPASNVASLPAPNLGDKLAQFEGPSDQRERVPVDNRDEAQQQARQDARQQGRQRQGQQQPDQSQQGSLVTGQEADRGQGGERVQQGAGTDLVPMTDEQRAFTAAQEFAAATIGFILKADQHLYQQNFGAPPHLPGNIAMLRRLDRLKDGFPDLHKQIADVRIQREKQFAQQAAA